MRKLLLFILMAMSMMGYSQDMNFESKNPNLIQEYAQEKNAMFESELTTIEWFSPGFDTLWTWDTDIQFCYYYKDEKGYFNSSYNYIGYCDLSNSILHHLIRYINDNKPVIKILGFDFTHNKGQVIKFVKSQIGKNKSYYDKALEHYNKKEYRVASSYLSNVREKYFTDKQWNQRLELGYLIAFKSCLEDGKLEEAKDLAKRMIEYEFDSCNTSYYRNFIAKE